MSAHESDSSADIPPSGTVFAGPGLDIGEGSCHSLSCRKANFDFDFSTLFHYFDLVAMQGLNADYVTRSIERMDEKGLDEGAIRTIAADASLMHYIRSIGMTKYVVFVQKEYPCLCDDHIDEQLAEVGLEHLADPGAFSEVVAEVVRTDHLKITQPAPGHWGGHLTHPMFSTTLTPLFKLERRPSKRWMAQQLVSRIVRTTVKETLAAKRLDAPLASVAQADFVIQELRRSRGVSPDDVALQLNIPILRAMPTANLLRLREEEYESFERFRQVLTEAIQAGVEKAGSKPASVIADEIWRNKIRPGVADIERKLEASSRAMIRKTVAGVTVGAIGAAVGALGGFPLIAAAGAAAAIGAPLPQLLKNLEERQQVELHDMYFLWKAQKAHRHDV
ncbi:hypothetical protein [Micromonospora sp. NPDC002575]|uniref:hypothetical protein n=1 Tax=Micromonospora sp. NPDC002575 TaxID=3364222 RepID=UPI0036AA94F5